MKTIPLTKSQHVIVDDNDYDSLLKHKWASDSKGYACRSERRSETGERKRKMVLMHRQIMQADDGIQVDHINGDIHDNRKSNLRFATPSQNMRNRKIQANNTSGYKGVWYNHRRDRFITTIKKNGMSKTIGSSNTAIEAAELYNEAAKELYGDFARLNDL